MKHNISKGITVHSGLHLHPGGPILYEVYRHRTDGLLLRIESLKNSNPLPILLYRRGKPCKKLVLEAVLELKLSDLSQGSYTVKSQVGEIFRFVID